MLVRLDPLGHEPPELDGFLDQIECQFAEFARHRGVK